MTKCSKARTPSCHVLGCSLQLVVSRLVWTDAVCSSAPYKFNTSKNVNVKVNNNALCADMTASELELCQGNAMSVLPKILYMVRLHNTYGAC